MRKAVVLAGLCLGLTGCPPARPPRPLEPLPLAQAIERINENARRVTTGLKATGSVHGQVQDPGGYRRSFDLQGKLLVIPPRHVRFDVQDALGRTEFLLGSNTDFFWAYLARDGDTLRFGRYATPEEDRVIQLPIRADWMIEALGINGLPADTTGIHGPVQRVEPDRQELLFISYAPGGQAMVRKEYWLSRYAPRLVQRVVYRDERGIELMRSVIRDYRPWREGGAMLPARIRLDWPAEGLWIEFQANRWQERSELTGAHPAFELGTLKSLRQQYARVVDIDTNLLGGTSADCNGNRIPDEYDLLEGWSRDCQHDRTPDECQLKGNDCDRNGVPDECETDCNGNHQPDACDLARGRSLDCNSNGLPDECERDCNVNGIPDDVDILGGTSADGDENGTPDECGLLNP